MNVYGLIGYPLGHSFSKKYFTEKFENENIADAVFELFPIENIDQFPNLISRVKDLKGLAVTIPHKTTVMPYLSMVDERAMEVGAVNCIKFHHNKSIGFNTDIIGFENSFSPLLKNNHTKALVLGSGGSSKAVQFVLKKLGIPFLIITRKEELEAGHIHYRSLDQEIIESYTIIINCTPVGMTPNEKSFPLIPYEYLGNAHLLFDLIYSPIQTEFLSFGLKKGATIKNGYEMLLIQAAENWRIWNE
jgi:shikimate dehydrogenase